MTDHATTDELFFTRTGMDRGRVDGLVVDEDLQCRSGVG